MYARERTVDAVDDVAVPWKALSGYMHARAHAGGAGRDAHVPALPGDAGEQLDVEEGEAGRWVEDGTPVGDAPVGAPARTVAMIGLPILHEVEQMVLHYGRQHTQVNGLPGLTGYPGRWEPDRHVGYPAPWVSGWMEIAPTRLLIMEVLVRGVTPDSPLFDVHLREASSEVWVTDKTSCY